MLVVVATKIDCAVDSAEVVADTLASVPSDVVDVALVGLVVFGATEVATAVLTAAEVVAAVVVAAVLTAAFDVG